MNKYFDELKEIEKLNMIFKHKHDYYNMNEKIKYWFNSIDSKEDRYVYLSLLDKFSYYSRKNIIESLRKVHRKVLEFDPTVNCTLFFPMFSKRGRNNHSFEIHNMYREANKLNKDSFIVDISYALRCLPMDMIHNIVFIDDMIGTGKTIETSILTIYHQYEDLFNKDIYIILLEVPDDIERIEKNISSRVGKRVKILYLNRHKKAFSENFIFNKHYLEEAKEIVKKYDKKLTNDDSNIFGYGNSEFLLSFYYDTPNNTITSLWKNNEKIDWNPPFSRSTKCNHYPTWLKYTSDTYNNAKQLKKQKQIRQNSNYNAKSKQR